MNPLQDPSKPATTSTPRIGGRALVRNTGLNLIGRIAPLLVAVAAMPYVIRQLGPDRDGLLSLAWMVVGYFALFDLGIGPATTKFVAELLGRGEVENLPEMVWTALGSQTAFGLLGGILFALSSPLLVYRLLKIPADLHAQAHLMLLILSVGLPISFASGSFRGVLAASQRFDLLNAITIPSSALNYLLPAVALAFGFGLPAIVLFLVLARMVSLIIFAVFCIRLHPCLGAGIRFDRRLVRPLLSFGGWVTVCGAIYPILTYYDRFLIGAIDSIAAVGFYTPPYLIATKLNILPSSLSETLFPAFSTSAGRGDTEWIRKNLIRALKFLLLAVGPVAMFLAFFARPLLFYWLGSTFSARGTLVLQILVVGVLIHSLSFIPFSLLQAIGRPDLTAKLQLSEVPIHLGLAWFLVEHLGLSGAAIAYTLRVSLDFLLLILAACWVTGISPRVLAAKELGRSIVSLSALGLGFAAVWVLTHTLISEAVCTLMLSGGYLLVAWRYVLTLDEKGQISRWVRTTR